MGNQSVHLSDPRLHSIASDRSLPQPSPPHDSLVIRDRSPLLSASRRHGLSLRSENSQQLANQPQPSPSNSDRDIPPNEIWRLSSQESIGAYLSDNNRQSLPTTTLNSALNSRSKISGFLSSRRMSQVIPITSLNRPTGPFFPKQRSPDYDQLITELQGLNELYADRPKGSFYDALHLKITQQINDHIFRVISEGGPDLGPTLERIIKSDKR